MHVLELDRELSSDCSKRSGEINRGKVKKESISSAEEVGKEMNWSLEAAKIMKEVTLNKLYNDHETLLSIFNLKEFSIIAFNEEIEKGEDPDYDLI